MKPGLIRRRGRRDQSAARNEFRLAGGGTYTVPAGVYELRVRGLGSGGSGGGAGSGGGQGGGAFEHFITVTSGDQFTYGVGALTPGGSGNVSGNPGQNTIFVGPGSDCVAYGGQPGIYRGGGGTGGGNATGGNVYNLTGANGGTVTKPGTLFRGGGGGNAGGFGGTNPDAGAGGGGGYEDYGRPGSNYGGGGGGAGEASPSGGSGGEGTIYVIENESET